MRGIGIRILVWQMREEIDNQLIILWMDVKNSQLNYIV